MVNDAQILGPIVGGVTSTGANIWARYQNPPRQAIIHAWVGQQTDMSDAQLLGRSMPLSADQGYAGVALVRDLAPDTLYYYSISLDDTRMILKKKSIMADDHPFFKTFPEPGKDCGLSFAFGSCFRPGQENGGVIFKSIERIAQSEDLRFLLLIGDQVYADDAETNSLEKVAETIDEYRWVYQQTWSNEHLGRLLARIPTFMMLDDHEVDDDWYWSDFARTKPAIPWWNSLFRWLGGASQSERTLSKRRVKAALQAYWEHQGMHGPPQIKTPILDNSGRYQLTMEDTGSLAYSFECGPASFFVMDTRTMRVKPSGFQKKVMLGSRQWAHLQDWLIRVKDIFRYKFIISSSSFLYTSLLDIPLDRWSGFSDERDQLLSFISSNSIQGVYILSGDFHFGFALRAELSGRDGEGVPIWEFCSSPFEQSTNTLAAETRINIHNRLIRRQERLFKVCEPNFGVIRILDTEGESEYVEFLLYNTRGELIHKTKQFQ